VPTCTIYNLLSMLYLVMKSSGLGSLMSFPFDERISTFHIMGIGLSWPARWTLRSALTSSNMRCLTTPLVKSSWPLFAHRLVVEAAKFFGVKRITDQKISFSCSARRVRMDLAVEPARQRPHSVVPSILGVEGELHQGDRDWTGGGSEMSGVCA